MKDKIKTGTDIGRRKFIKASTAAGVAAAVGPWIVSPSVLASSGSGPLKSAVEEYQLGVFVTPDDDEEILEGARKLVANEIQTDWQRYERDNSWKKNAKLVIQAFE